MTLEIGSLVEGRVSGIARFGAFVNVDGETGLVHISEIANQFVTDVSQFLKVGDQVEVKVLGINKQGKYDLSIRQARLLDGQAGQTGLLEGAISAPARLLASRGEPDGQGQLAGHPAVRRMTPRQTKKAPETFEEKITQFLKQSEEKLLDLKRNLQFKQEGRKKK